MSTIATYNELCYGAKNLTNKKLTMRKPITIRSFLFASFMAIAGLILIFTDETVEGQRFAGMIAIAWGALSLVYSRKKANMRENMRIVK